jgi:hypothetical protein
MIEAGDIFTRKLKFEIPKPKDSTSRKEFRYFGELESVDSLYQMNYNANKKLKQVALNLNKEPLEISLTSKEPVKTIEKCKTKDVRNKKLIETKIFDKLSLYNFRNKRLDSQVQFGLLPQDKYQKYNFENKIEKIKLVLDIDNKRKVMGFTFDENMDKMYDNDIREIMGAIDAKRRKAYEDKHGTEMIEETRIDTTRLLLTKDDDKTTLVTDDIDDISSIDSDTKREEKKFRMHDGVLGGGEFNS